MSDEHSERLAKWAAFFEDTERRNAYPPLALAKQLRAAMFSYDALTAENAQLRKRVEELDRDRELTRKNDGNFVSWPHGWPKYRQPFLGGEDDYCDMLVGPCVCGAWHERGEFILVDGVIHRNLFSAPH